MRRLELIIAALSTGCRLGELLTLQWSQIRRDDQGQPRWLVLAADRWVSMNLWSFTPTIFDACERVQPSKRGELEIQDAVSIAMCDLGVTFRVVRLHDAVLDLTQRSDIAAVSSRLAAIDPQP